MTPCIEWTGYRNPQGYGIHKDAEFRDQKAHRVAYAKAHGLTMEQMAGRLVCHKCDNPPCINVAHLFLGSYADNHADMDRKDRRPRGERCAAASLTLDQVREIRELCNAGVRQREIADRFGIGQAQVSRINTRREWRRD